MLYMILAMTILLITYFYNDLYVLNVSVNIGPEYTVLFNDLLIAYGDNVPLKIIPEPHISLTRTVVLLHHWIDTFIDSVRLQFRNYTR